MELIDSIKFKKEDGTVSHEKLGIHGVNLDCRFGYGASVNVTAMFGFVTASRVMARIIKKLSS